jgi:hypothetical protein
VTLAGHFTDGQAESMRALRTGLGADVVLGLQLLRLLELPGRLFSRWQRRRFDAIN